MNKITHIVQRIQKSPLSHRPPLSSSWTNSINSSTPFPTPLITLVCINNQPLKRITLYALTHKKILFLKVTEINSQVLTQSEKPVDLNTTKTKEGFLSKIFSLMNKNPNYKMLGALGMMLVNFSVCVTIANWLKHSSLVS